MLEPDRQEGEPAVHLYELAWILPSIALPVAMLVAILITAFGASPKLGLWQVGLWLGGMVVFSNSLHRLGLMGVPRRTMLGAAPYVQPEWKHVLPLVGVGGTVLFVSAMLYFLNIGLTVLASRGPAPEPPEFAEALSGPERSPAIFDKWWPWLSAAVVLVAIAYVPTLLHLGTTSLFSSPGYRVW